MAAVDPNASPISQLLNTLGLTREDLHKRSDEMRQFLTADGVKTSRVLSRGRADSSSSSNVRSLSRSNSSFSASARSLSRASSSSLRDASPPSTPVKSEPTEAGLPLRQFDSMEVVIERQRQARKEKKQKKDKEKEFHSRRSASLASPTLNNASARDRAVESLLRGRDGEHVDVKGQPSTALGGAMEARSSPSPLTPQQAKYYREHTLSQTRSVVPKVESPPTTPVAQQEQASPSPYYPHLKASFLPTIPAIQTNMLPVTPQMKRVHSMVESGGKSPLPPSSPPVMSPQSSPVRGIVNLVSSPGPMGPPPEESSYSRLPYTLPPGPYSPNKPDLSYAALLGRAILSSADHRLTLQEIYDWITIVYPFFKRGETTWMNSIRHVLSTTPCFRKVTRDRALGRTQWAIWDEDLECFKGGGFRKQFCKDMNGGKPASEASMKTKRGRKDSNEGSSDRKSKKAKRDKDKGPQRAILPNRSLPIFPPSRPAPPLQPYRESSIVHTMAPDIVFPPLPAASGLRQLSGSRAMSHADTEDMTSDTCPTSSSVQDVSYQGPPPSSASTSSVPDLTPNCSSSSPLPSTSDMELDAPISIAEGKTLAVAPSVTVNGINTSDEEGDDDDEESFAATKLTPVQFWGASPKRKDLARPGKLKSNGPVVDSEQDSEDGRSLFNAVKNRNAKQKKSKMVDPFERLPASPTSNVRKATTRAGKSKAAASKAKAVQQNRLTTPLPLDEAPRTPPPVRQLQLSPVHTPLSHKGLHMSPSASLAHYKSHLDPPRVIPYESYSMVAPDEELNELLHSSVRGQSGTSGGTPVTPKRHTFPLLDDSPFRTSFGMSPFRTPGSRGIIDPHDPRILLDEELTRIGSSGYSYSDSSPASGLFGKERQLLYDSPNGLDSSPGTYKRWW